MTTGSRAHLLAIAILVLFLLQKTPLVLPALALRGLNVSLQNQNGSLPINSTASTYLPDPSNCDPPETSTHMGTFSSANYRKEPHRHGTDAIMQSSLASNFSERQNSTDSPPRITNRSVSDFDNSSSTVEHKSPNEQYQSGDMKSDMVKHVSEGAVVHIVNEDAGLYEIASLHDPSSAVDDSVQSIVMNDNGDTVQVHVKDLDRSGDVFWINNSERLADSTPPPGDTSIHTAAQSSVARESMQVMEITEEDLFLAEPERLGSATPPPIDTSIHTAGQKSAARESLPIVLEMSEEQLGASTPPPADSDIHTASQSSVARESSF